MAKMAAIIMPTAILFEWLYHSYCFCSEKPPKSGTNLPKNYICSEKPVKLGTNPGRRQLGPVAVRV